MLITSIGELLVDFTPAGESENGNSLYEANCGGACANVAAAAALLGCEAAFAGKVGDDFFGEMLTARLARCGVNTEGVIADPVHATTLAFVHLDGRGERSFRFFREPGAETCLLPGDIPKTLLDRTDILHWGSIPLTGEPSRSTIREIAREQRSAGKTVSFDVNLRPALWKDLREAREFLLTCLPFCDILKVSEEELAFLTGSSAAEPEKGAAQLAARYGIPMVLATLGEKGVYCLHDGEAQSCPALSGLQVRDTTGAGDCFVGAFLTRIPREGLSGLHGEGLRDALRFACAAAGLSVTGKGAIPSMPSLDAVEIVLKERRF